jgi:UDP-N-acetylmuramoyl-tripeptide--D-alanyl-D-alanine ligase
MVNPQYIQQDDLASYIIGKIPEEDLPLFTDSRKVISGGLFVALVGESFDAFSFIPQVVNGGARLVVYQNGEGRRLEIEAIALEHPECCFVSVEDTLKFLQRLAHLHLKRWKEESGGKVLAITGSNGKTTYKNMLRHFLRSIVGEQIHATDGNFNNHIGVPLTLFGLTSSHRYLVIELGTNHPGEIPLLCDIAMPDGGLITNIGNAHLEFFHSEENIFKEKSTLYHYVKKMQSGMPFVVSSDDKFLSRLEGFSGFCSWGEESGAVRIELLRDQQQVKLALPAGSVVLTNKNILGDHNFKNLAATFLISSMIFPGEIDQLISAASSFEPSHNRSSWVELNKKHYFLDAYNANPASMETALRSFVTHCLQKELSLSSILVILGDMNELGEGAPLFHQQIGGLLSSLGIKRALFVGRFASCYEKGFKGEAKNFDSVQDVAAAWQEIECSANYFFIKGSRSLQLESLIDIN